MTGLYMLAQYVGMNGESIVNDEQKAQFQANIEMHDFSEGNVGVGGATAVAPDIYVTYRGEETVIPMPIVELDINGDLMEEKTKSWLSKKTMAKIADVTIENKLTAGMVFNPTELAKDPHEIMAEKLNISDKEALTLYKKQVQEGTYVPVKEPAIFELRE